MPFTALLFSGGLDSVAFGIVLRRKGHELEPVYCSHRHGGNVTKKEVKAASDLAMDVCGRPLVVVKAPTANETWWEEVSAQIAHSRLLPVPKERKDQRNRVFIRALRETGILEAVDHVALGVLGVDGETEFLDEESAEKVIAKVGASRLRDVTHEDIERDAKLDPGVLITPAALGITGKVNLLRSVGRRESDQKLCLSSESCLMYFNKPCGNCASCKSRVQAFMEAWGKDSTPYRPGTWAARHKRARAR